MYKDNMYNKEQILEEIKRIAASMGVKSITEEDFERHSTLPLSTLRFHLGSWARALKEAGLAAVEPARVAKKREPHNDDELLSDLIRLYEDSGELPTPALIHTKGKFTERHYKDRWRSIDEAFKMARLKFPEKFKPSPPQAEILSPLQPPGKIAAVESVDPLGETNEEGPRDKLAVEDPVESQGEEPMIYNNEEIKSRDIKLIPPTIKPQKVQLKPRIPIEPIDFRGLRFAPTNKPGTAYLFGMISRELGFLIEGFIKTYPDCEGKRCVDQENNRWEQVRIQLEYKSSDFKESAQANGYDERQCDLMVCWAHDWPECPFEVLELRSILPLLT